MNTKLALIVTALLAVLGSRIDAADAATVLQYGVSDDLTFYLGGDASKSLIKGVDGRTAIRIDIAKAGEKNWSVLHHSPPNTKPVGKGDFVVFEIETRVTGERTTEGSIGVYAESAVKEKQGSVGEQVHPTTELRTFRRSVVSPNDFEPGEFILSVHLGIKAQVVEFYGAKMEVYPADTDPELLRLDGIDWTGRSLDAAWRDAANQRIEKIRKQDLSVSVVDADGNPVDGAEVTINQQKHAWRFGTFVGSKMLGDTEDAKRYREAVKSRYNFVTLPAYLANWGWLSETNRRHYFQLADWAQNEGIPARGHLLVYPGWTATPPEWFDIPKPELRTKLA
ncbi:hypothetical protein N9N28_01600, partial [Rubripirellula amarantea]|nr:hypothetical protein [Rubripirellula amarantea]